ncbi:transposase family protein [Streptomyces sp. NPDC059262]|uniref:transposase family protein n=2 Tax=unclassified Streptomyces TaxID=2593676 RepID=UPI00368DBD4B
MESVRRTVGTLTSRASCPPFPARCTGCRMPPWRVHGRYVRRLSDAPLGGAAVVIELTVRRFKCLNSACPAVTFAEQIPGLTSLHSRYTPLLPGVLRDQMIQAMDTAKRQGLQMDLRALAANIRADAEGRYDGAEPGWRAGVEWTLLWIENTAAQLTEGSSADGRQGVSPE